ncbi:MAG: amino acid ABC transporter ATP-binding protein [Chloroflexota bacterium]
MTVDNVARSENLGPDRPAETEILRIEGVNKWFQRTRQPRVHILKDVNLQLHRGEVVCVIGPSGSGKSTLLRCVNFIAPPETGRVVFLGREWCLAQRPRFDPVAKWRYQRELMELRSQIGMVFQHFNLFPHLTVIRNVALAPMRVRKMTRREAEERGRQELERVGLGDKADAYPSQLSGGQRQRVAIARALAMQPRLMLFDEVTSALDPELVNGILEEMKKLAMAGMTMIVVTHEMGFAREVGDRVVFMDAGQIVEQGRARQLLQNPQNPRTQAFLSAIL